MLHSLKYLNHVDTLAQLQNPVAFFFVAGGIDAQPTQYATLCLFASEICIDTSFGCSTLVTLEMTYFCCSSVMVGKVGKTTRVFFLYPRQDCACTIFFDLAETRIVILGDNSGAIFHLERAGHARVNASNLAEHTIDLCVRLYVQ